MADNVADAVEQDWEIELIPDADRIFMRIHRQWLKPDGTVAPGAFKDQGDSMSTDWDKYRTAQEARTAARVPVDNAVISMNVGKVRTIPNTKVQHDPMPDNRAHTGVIGPKTSKERVLYGDIYKFEILVTDQI